MEFDWEGFKPLSGGSLNTVEIEESFEDPFSVKLMPDSVRFSEQARYFNIGKTVKGLGVFSVYRTNGRQVKVILARLLEPEENFFYERHQSKLLNQT
ncbi:MAG: hypothetical protein EXS24_05125 [Pedosphaera sp.]|nr:hypothetical protein [Pedosphaera sp.]